MHERGVRRMLALRRVRERGRTIGDPDAGPDYGLCRH